MEREIELSNEVHVFYDKSAREENDDTLPIISEKYLHSMFLQIKMLVSI